MAISRRILLTSVASLASSTWIAHATKIHGALPWHPNAGHPPREVRPGPWQYFNFDEASAVEAVADRLVPSDPAAPGGKDAGCAVYIDRQLAGPYGESDGLFKSGPFLKGTKQQGPQSSVTPAALYRKGLEALDKYCRGKFDGKRFAQLEDADKDGVLRAMESGESKFDGVDAKKFFEQLLKDVRQGFFADPIYGGNRNLAAWKMIGFPGARYNYLDWIDRHNERFPLPPVGIAGSIQWTPKG